MRIGIIGGTFNPPHFGHLLIANEALHAAGLDEVWFMPNQAPPHKASKDLVSHEDRLNMLKLAVKDHAKFKIETIELERPGPSYTFETMKQLTALFPKLQFYFIIGADMIEYLPKWYKIDELLELVTFIGVNRPTYRRESPYPLVHIDIPEFKVSSSLIRKRLKEGSSVRYLLPDSVIDYIKEKQLYGTE